MPRIPKTRLSADEIAAKASRGEDVSGFLHQQVHGGQAGASAGERSGRQATPETEGRLNGARTLLHDAANRVKKDGASKDGP
jgi:hypothetical protein